MGDGEWVLQERISGLLKTLKEKQEELVSLQADRDRVGQLLVERVKKQVSLELERDHLRNLVQELEAAEKHHLHRLGEQEQKMAKLDARAAWINMRLEQVRAEEREACARVAESYEPHCESCPRGVTAAIRNRGEA